jgi:hypothetical protein
LHGPRLRKRQLGEAQPRGVAAAKVVANVIRDARRFAFSILVTGSDFAQASMLFLWNDIIPPSETAFYTAQKGLFVPLEEIVRYSCKLTRDSLVGNILIAFDGSWSRRNAKECIVVVIIVGTNKILD